MAKRHVDRSSFIMSGLRIRKDMHAWAWYTLTVSNSGPCPRISIHTLEYNPSGVGHANDKFAMPNP